MQTFRILYFRDFVLEKTEPLEGFDLLEAIDKASAARAPDVTVEIWSENGKVGTVEPSPAQNHAGVDPPHRARSSGSAVRLPPLPARKTSTR